jgi:hypothetical protein|tara:strand:+ start:4908 stop:5573 length:666 start_codon:yes stop_codon:yes gene_type:complete
MGEENTSEGEVADTTTLLTDKAPAGEEKAELAADAATDGKGAEASAADHDTDDTPKDGAADKGKDGAPSEYEAFTLPEGVELSDAMLAEATPLLKELGATQEQAQALVDFQTQTLSDMAETQAQVWKDQINEWKASAETDAEYGKGKYDQSVMLARSAMREIGSPELTQVLEETGMGNHPEMIRVFYRIGKAIGEDTVSFGGGTQEGGKSLADRLFPNQGS